MTATATKNVNLASIVHESEAAAKEAADAVAKAQAASAKADQARKQAEEQRAIAYKSYFDKITAEYPERHAAALATQAESHAALEQAVRSGGDVFPTYFRWVEASTRLWEVDAEREHIRRHHGAPSRDAAQRVFKFDFDISEIIDRVAAELQDDAAQRITARRTAFVNGRTA